MSKHLLLTLSLCALLVETSSSLIAQQVFLPVSSTSEAAIQRYYNAVDATFKFDTETFLDEIDKSIALDPNFFMAHFQRAMIARFMGAKETSIASFEKALAASAEQLNQAELILHQLTPRLIQLIDAQGDNIFEELIAAFPDIAQCYFLATMNAWTFNDYEASLDFARQMVQSNPTLAEGYNTLGFAYMSNGQMEEAEASFQKYIELAPNDANAYDSMGEYYMNQQDYKQSAIHYQKAFQLGHASAEAKATFARRMLRQN